MLLPKRKSPRLKYYDYAQKGAYFITICTKNRESLLCEIVGGDAHIAPLNIELYNYGKIVKKYIEGVWGIQKYIIMPNHIHMIISLYDNDNMENILGNKEINESMRAPYPTSGIPQLVKSFKMLVTKEIGVSIWQRSYHDRVIRNENEYKKIAVYIEDNPLQWKLDYYYC